MYLQKSLKIQRFKKIFGENMREPEKCVIDYCGFSEPRDDDEIRFEILGLKNLIDRANERISMLNQSMFLANKMIHNENKDIEEI